MKSLKIKGNMYGEVAVGSDDGYYPSVSFNENSLPGLKKKKVGETCELKIKAKVVGIRANSKSTTYELELLQGEEYSE